MVRKSASSTSTMASNDSGASSTGGGFLAKTFSWRAGKTSTSTTSTAGTSVSGSSDRGLGSSKGFKAGGGVTSAQPGAKKHGIGNTIDCPLAGQSKKCNKLPPLEASPHDSYDDEEDNESSSGGICYSNMTEAQRHQAQLRAYTIKFGASQPWRRSFEGVSPCSSPRPSLDMDCP